MTLLGGRRGGGMEAQRLGGVAWTGGKHPPPVPPDPGPPARASAILSGLAQRQVPQVTPDLIAAQGARMQQLNALTIQGTGTGLPNAGWIDYAIDRASIVVPIDAPNGHILYRPHARPNNANASAGDAEDYTLQSQTAGVAYLPRPGLWSLKYTGTGLLRVLVIDASDANLASLLLSKPGAVTASAPATSTVSGAANVVSTILGPNPLRRGLIIENDSAASAILRIGLGANPSATTGLALVVNGTLTLTDAILWKGDVRVTSGSAYKVDWCEFE